MFSSCPPIPLKAPASSRGRSVRRLLSCIAVTGMAALPLHGQITPVAPPKVEPGLEEAVHWKWRIVPADEKDWGLPLPETAAPHVGVSAVPGAPAPAGTPGSNPLEPRPVQYEVQKGDALILIGRKFGLTAQQLKTFNGLDKDTIRIGQVLKIPTLEEVKAMQPPPPPTPPPQAESKSKDKENEQAKDAKSPASTKATPIGQLPGQEDLLFQVFLDREGFATGPIDGSPGPMLTAVQQLYRDGHEDAQNIDEFRKKARETVGDPLTHYTLKAEDFRFIAVSPEKRATLTKKGAKTFSEPPPPTYDELTAAPSLVYRSVWEFVAERFHCNETFLREMNPRIKSTPAVGAQFNVPNVIPFEIEHALEGSLQPPAEPEHPVTAAIVDLSRLEISREGKLVAVMPLALARPDLRGRGSWTILDAIPRPRLATLREPKEPPKSVAPIAGVDPAATAAPPPKAMLAAEQFLNAGPNNPVGIVWINLAKAKSTEPLPYGLHGTSIPGRMKTQEGIGGIRLANWDMARAVKLLPAGTALQWK